MTKPSASSARKIAARSPRLPQRSTAFLLVGALFLQWAISTLFCLFVLENEVVATTIFSRSSWAFWLTTLGGHLQSTPDGLMVNASLGGISVIALLGCLGVNAFSAILNRRRTKHPFSVSFTEKSIANARWSCVLALWAIGWIVSLFVPALGLTLVLTVKLAAAATLAGWFWEALRELLVAPICNEVDSTSKKNAKPFRIVLVGMAAYTLIFVGMNWGLWFNLQLPHGDSSMYEEHLWNFLHGKGFRSYLDQGLFLGEHIQVIHLLLIPIYLIWPSHLTMELCESLALASGAIPVYWMAQRHSKNDRAAMWLALAYLLYFPMHYLDIAIDLKTFRPGAFGIPILLFMIDAAERRRWGWMSFWVVLALMCQEDFPVMIGPFGVWLLYDIWQRRTPSVLVADRSQLIAGALLAVLMPLYVIFAVKVAIPWFHDGATVHYASYFQAFGKTPFEIVINILTNPLLLWTQLVTAGSIALFFQMLLPAGLPLRSWTRLLVGLPLFVLLCLNELTKSFPGPFHHFHAPVIPVVFWAACANLSGWLPKSPAVETKAEIQSAVQRGLFVFCCAAATSLFFSISPVGIQFWDSGSPFYWKQLYVPGERAKQFAKIPPLIPATARVASTDFVHPRFTHYERSYDYSHYPRRVANYEDKVPDDTDYIVIDTQHRYSEIRRFEETREFKHQRDQWEELPVDTQGYFIVLKRVKPASAPESQSKR